MWSVGGWSLWRPEQSAGIYRLDLKRFLGDGAAGKNGPPLPDVGEADVHPLATIALILADSSL